MRIAVVLSVLLAVPALAAGPTETEKKPRLVVNDLVPLRVAPEEAHALTDSVVTSLAGRGLFEVLGSRDIQTILGAERQRQLVEQVLQLATHLRN